MIRTNFTQRRRKYTDSKRQSRRKAKVPHLRSPSERRLKGPSGSTHRQLLVLAREQSPSATDLQAQRAVSVAVTLHARVALLLQEHMSNAKPLLKRFDHRHRRHLPRFRSSTRERSELLRSVYLHPITTAVPSWCRNVIIAQTEISTPRSGLSKPNVAHFASNARPSRSGTWLYAFANDVPPTTSNWLNIVDPQGRN